MVHDETVASVHQVQQKLQHQVIKTKAPGTEKAPGTVKAPGTAKAAISGD